MGSPVGYRTVPDIVTWSTHTPESAPAGAATPATATAPMVVTSAAATKLPSSLFTVPPSSRRGIRDPLPRFLPNLGGGRKESGAAHADAVDGERHAGGRGGQPLDVVADGDGLFEHALDGGRDGDLANRLG